jgi:hypothetical protein
MGCWWPGSSSGSTSWTAVPWLAGLAIGFGVNIKFTAVVLIPYLLLRRRFCRRDIEHPVHGGVCAWSRRVLGLANEP